MQKRGLPTLKASNGKLIPLENYQDQLWNIATDTSKFTKLRGTITGEASLEGLQYDLYIQHEVHHLFLNKPTFQTYTKVDEIFRGMVNLSIPSEERWDKILEIFEWNQIEILQIGSSKTEEVEM